MERSTQDLRQITLVGICFLFVCILDWFTPLYAFGGIGFLYIAAILLTMHESRKMMVYTAVFATLLIVLNYLYFSGILKNIPQTMIPFNRMISIFGLWITVVVALKFKQADQKLSTQKAAYTEKIDEIVYINSHKVRNPVANIVKLVELMDDIKLSDQQAKQMLNYLHQSAKELEIATREMTDKISDKESKRYRSSIKEM